MDLHGLVSTAINAVNPFVSGVVQISDGYTTADDGSRTPKYKPYRLERMQVQPLSWRDLQQVDGLNLNGTRRKIYIQGQLDGVVRLDKKGGDVIVMDDGRVFIVAQVLEQWPDWASVAVTLQNETNRSV